MAERVSAREIQKIRLQALVLPQAERHELERRYGPGVRPRRLSLGFGALEFLLGLALYAATHPGVGGAIGWSIWHANPLTWLALMLMIVGLLRVVNFVANDDAFGEPLVWAFLRLLQPLRRAQDRKRIEEAFGPERPDRVVVDDDGGLILLTSRAKPGWDEYNTLRIEDDFFTIETIEERRDGRYRAVAYRLEEVPESEPLRGIVHTEARLPPGYVTEAAAGAPGRED